MNDAVRCPCFSDTLNQSLSKSSSVFNRYMQNVGYFDVHRKDQLSGLCKAHWAEQHSAELRSSLADIQLLNIVAGWQNQTSSAANASVLIVALRTSNVLVALLTMSDILALPKPLSRHFQKETLDLNTAVDVLHGTLALRGLNERSANPSAGNCSQELG